MSRSLRRALSAVAVVGVGALLVTPLAASAATKMLIRGTVACSAGQPAVGVWIESSAGGSEWADDQSWQFTTSQPNRSYRYFEETVTSPSSKSKISLHVGCGGTPSRWSKDLWSEGFPVGSTGRVINVACDYAKRSRTVGACKQAPKGSDAGVNPYASTSKYCTGGAVYRWYKATGYWPLVNRSKSYSEPKDGTSPGDAKWIDDNAASRGFRVSKIPHIRSMVVFNNRSKWGHVGWVTRIYRSSGRVYFDYIDRNGGNRWINASLGQTNDYGRDVTRKGQAWDSSQRFVVARVYPK